MLSIKEFKEALGDEALGLTEEQILKLRENQDQHAEILFSLWLENSINK